MARAICLVLLLAISNVLSFDEETCEVRARTVSGRICGVLQKDARNRTYASFRGVPYAKQPLKELRFQELQPAEPWSHLLDATVEGPTCPQTDVLYGKLMQSKGMSEECIHANIHVPIAALRRAHQVSEPSETKQEKDHPGLPPAVGAQEETAAPVNNPGFPILVFIHGGGFAFGSGDTDLYGPEYLVSKDVIVITFNYRLNVMGFLSLNTSKVPGNNGLRDMITLLRWVKDNARFFGGNPDDVTLGGQSAGAVSAHLLTLSPEADGLFKRAILMSGTAIPTFYTTSPVYAQYIANAFISGLGINSTDPDEIHHQLATLPIESLMAVNKYLLDHSGVAVFFPVVESPLPGVKRILTDDPEALVAQGVGKDIPLLIGFTDAECETFRNRFVEVDIMGKLDANPLMILSPSVTFSSPPEISYAKAEKIKQRYVNDTDDLDGFILACSEQYFTYGAYKAAKYRSRTGGAPAFLYKFSYDGFYSTVKKALDLLFSGAGHIEDMTFIFKTNSVPVPPNGNDAQMRELMIRYVVNFIRTSQPTSYTEGYFSWRPIDQDGIRYQVLHSANAHRLAEPTDEEYATFAFFENIMARG